MGSTGPAVEPGDEVGSGVSVGGTGSGLPSPNSSALGTEEPGRIGEKIPSPSFTSAVKPSS